MRLSISNIGWSSDNDQHVYQLMKEMGFTGLEIAPTRIFPEKPYKDLSLAKNWANQIKCEYGFEISSMQSIWFGRSERVFGSAEERKVLIDYTKKAIDFAEIVGCRNLVFGCPRNRFIPDGMHIEDSICFFKEIGDYAYAHNCVVAMEANPPIYNTNFINTTEQALNLIKMVNSNGFLLNLDVGTMVVNGESVLSLEGKEAYIHHVHISEPGLESIKKRKLHIELANILRQVDYNGFVSIEVGRQEKVDDILAMMMYVKDCFEKCR